MKINDLRCAAVVWLAMGIATAQQPARTNLVGAVQAIDPANGQITLHTDDGKTVKITPHAGAKFLRVPPGEKMANATPITANDISPGDRLLARGELSDDKTSLAATTLVVMTKADIAKKQQADQAEWQKRGVGGLVTAVDAKAGEVTINTRTMEGTKPLIIVASEKTFVRRYAPDSVKFAEAGRMAETRRRRSGYRGGCQGRRSDHQHTHHGRDQAAHYRGEREDIRPPVCPGLSEIRGGQAGRRGGHKGGRPGAGLGRQKRGRDALRGRGTGFRIVPQPGGDGDHDGPGGEHHEGDGSGHQEAVAGARESGYDFTQAAGDGGENDRHAGIGWRGWRGRGWRRGRKRGAASAGCPRSSGWRRRRAGRSEE